MQTVPVFGEINANLSEFAREISRKLEKPPPTLFLPFMSLHCAIQI